MANKLPPINPQEFALDGKTIGFPDFLTLAGVIAGNTLASVFPLCKPVTIFELPIDKWIVSIQLMYVGINSATSNVVSGAAIGYLVQGTSSQNFNQATNIFASVAHGANKMGIQTFVSYSSPLFIPAGTKLALFMFSENNSVVSNNASAHIQFRT